MKNFHTGVFPVYNINSIFPTKFPSISRKTAQPADNRDNFQFDSPGSSESSRESDIGLDENILIELGISMPTQKTGPPKAVYYTKELGVYRQCFQPAFDYPKTCSQFLGCKARDFLLVLAGLINILLLQFALVIIMHAVNEDSKNLGA